MDFLGAAAGNNPPPWKVLLVDDEPEVHEVTRLVLAGFRFEGRPLQILSALSAREARDLLQAHDDVAVALLDVVMETDQAGLDLAQYIRSDLGNADIRLVLRTGQPGQAPEHEVIERYDINDYKEKTELTAQKLSTTLFAALRAWRDIMTIRAHKRGLERVIEASAQVFAHERTSGFASAVLSQLANLVGMERGALYFTTQGETSDADSHFVATAATGDFQRLVDQNIDESLPANMLDTLRAALSEKRHQFSSDHYVLHFTDSQHGESLLYVGEAWDLSELDYKLVEIFCTNVSIAFENLQLNQEVSNAQMEMIFLLAGAAETRSSETASHVNRVGLIAELLAREIGMDEAYCERLRQAAPLHDLGKIGIPDAILNKAGAHTPEESAIMRTHAAIGHRMLAPSKRGILQLAAEVALTHHERWDGTGYPNGLAGEDIPISGRITMLADVFDALGSRRCYKEAWTADRIRAYITEHSGKMFDPVLTGILLEHWERAEAIRDQLPD